MGAISAKLVSQLRQETGLGMMECKKALVECDGDFDEAKQYLRVRSNLKADDVSGRVNKEGIIAIATSGATGAILEINSETDFVAREDAFIAFAQHCAETVVSETPADLEQLIQCETEGVSIEQQRRELIMKIGENITFSRFNLLNAKGFLYSYIHQGSRIGVIVDISTKDSIVGKDMCLHIAAMKPKAIDADGLDQNMLNAERAVYVTQAEESEKPPEIVEKMVEGRVRKYIAEVTLLNQPFVKDPDKTVAQYLSNANATVNHFCLFIVGEDKKDQ